MSNRKQDQVRATHFRATVTPMVNSLTKWTEGQEIVSAITLTNPELVPDQNWAMRMLRFMANNGLIRGRKSGKTYQYIGTRSGNGNGNGSAPEYAQAKPSVIGRVPHARIDLIESTGRIEIELQGIILQIGVRKQ